MTMPTPRWAAGLATLLIAGTVLAGVAPTSAAASPGTAASTAAIQRPGVVHPAQSASSALAGLTIKAKASSTGYTRDQFGTAWTDNQGAPGGHNGCDTRNDVLRRDLTSKVIEADGCVVDSGHLSDPYAGKSISFVRGVGTSTAVQIDHIVALSDAWQTGAQSLTKAVRTNLANDPLNLWAVDGPTNESKGDKDAADWVPPKTSSDCMYVARQVAIKKAYALWVTQAEHDAIASVLASCPSFALPTESDWAVPAPS
ncbi:MAG: HNH endonuclease family protein [Jatrophihabitantaceae bacterium]